MSVDWLGVGGWACALRGVTPNRMVSRVRKTAAGAFVDGRREGCMSVVIVKLC